MTESTRRSALQTFMLSDGTTLNVGDWACTPVRAIMQDARYYPSPLEFSGFRFVEEKVLSGHDLSSMVRQERSSRLIDANDTYHVWGTGRMSWYATLPLSLLKLTEIIAQGDTMLRQLLRLFYHKLFCTITVS
jgi:hypothetical protein